MATSFKQYNNFARTAVTTTDALNNTTNPITITVDDGSVFATIANGQRVVISSTTDPMNDASREVAEITARSTNSITLSRPNAVAHTGKPYIFNTVLAADLTDITGAINTAEGTLATAVSDLSALTTVVGTKGPKSFEKVVAADGTGDYTTINACLAAGYGRIRLMPGTYNENSANMNTYTLTTKDIYIEGLDRTNTIIQVSNTAANYWAIKYPAIIKNVTIYVPGTNSGDTSASGAWVRLTSNITFVDCFIKGNNSGSTSSPLFGLTSNTQVRFINCEEIVTHGAEMLSISSAAPEILMTGFKFIDTTTASGYYYKLYANQASSGKFIICNNILTSTGGRDNGLYKFSIGGLGNGGQLIFMGNNFSYTISSILDVSSPATGACIIIEGNNIKTSGQTQYPAINIDNSANSGTLYGRIKDNNIYWGASSGTISAIKLTTPKGIRVDGNVIRAQQTNQSAQRGIQISDPTDCFVTNNIVTGFGGTTGKGIYITGSGTCAVVGNVFSGNTMDIDNAATNTYNMQSTMAMTDAKDISFGTTTGTKIGTATSQKLALWNATPIVQPTTAISGAAMTANSGTAVNDASTFAGYTVGQVVAALRAAGILA